jgi:hypothetical protein
MNQRFFFHIFHNEVFKNAEFYTDSKLLTLVQLNVLKNVVGQNN